MKQNWRLPKQQHVADEEKSLIEAASHFHPKHGSFFYYYYFNFKLHFLQVGTFLFQN